MSSVFVLYVLCQYRGSVSIVFVLYVLHQYRGGVSSVFVLYVPCQYRGSVSIVFVLYVLLPVSATSRVPSVSWEHEYCLCIVCSSYYLCYKYA